VRFTKVPEDYDPTNRDAVVQYLAERRKAGEVATGLLYVDPTGQDMHSTLGTVERPLAQVPFEELCPGSEALEKLQQVFR